MKPISEVISDIVKNNLKLPCPIWFKYSSSDEIQHVGHITVITPTSVWVTYQTNAGTAETKMQFHPIQTQLVAELDVKDYQIMGD